MDSANPPFAFQHRLRSADLLFLQEVGKGFIDDYRTHRDMQRSYDLRLAKSADPARFQNSLIFYQRCFFVKLPSKIWGFIKDIQSRAA